MFHILYTSRSTEHFSDEKLITFLQKARSNNMKANITSMLLYCQETFIQILEGEKNTVMQTFERLKSDLRHSNINVITSGETNNRQFPE